jgi:hypothetical protein
MADEQEDETKEKLPAVGPEGMGAVDDNAEDDGKKADIPDDIAIDAGEGTTPAGGEPAPTEGAEEEAGKKQACVTVVDPEGNETVFALDRAVTNIGREETNHIALPDPKCSRKHFVIEMAGDFYNAIDMNSTNGIRVNGYKVTRRRLRDGDVIMIGKHKLIYAGPTDTSEPDELANEPPPKGTAIAESVSPLGEEKPPEPAAQLDFQDDTSKCPGCKGDIPPAQACPSCGYKSFRFRAVENYVDHIARDNSLLGGLGLWKLKRGKVLQQAWEREDVEWVLILKCSKCNWKHRIVNEFKSKCFPCEHCGAEIICPVHEPPKLE